MKRNELLLVGAVAVGAAVLFWPKKAQAQPGGGGTKLPDVDPGVGLLNADGRSWSGLGKQLVKQKLDQCAAFPMVPDAAVPTGQGFTLQPSPFTSSIANASAIVKGALMGGSLVYTRASGFTGDSSANPADVAVLYVTSSPAPLPWVLLASPSDPGPF